VQHLTHFKNLKAETDILILRNSLPKLMIRQGKFPKINLNNIRVFALQFSSKKKRKSTNNLDFEKFEKPDLNLAKNLSHVNKFKLPSSRDFSRPTIA